MSGKRHANGDGAANGRGPLAAYLGARLREHGVEVGRPEECWLYKGPLFANTGVRFSVGGTYVMGLRFAYMLAWGHLPAGRLHRTCSNKRCCNVLAHVTERPVRTLVSDSTRYRLRQLARSGADVWDLARRFGFTAAAVTRALGQPSP